MKVMCWYERSDDFSGRGKHLQELKTQNYSDHQSILSFMKEELHSRMHCTCISVSGANYFEFGITVHELARHKLRSTTNTTICRKPLKRTVMHVMLLAHKPPRWKERTINYLSGSISRVQNSVKQWVQQEVPGDGDFFPLLLNFCRNVATRVTPLHSDHYTTAIVAIIQSPTKVLKTLAGES